MRASHPPKSWNSCAACLLYTSGKLSDVTRAVEGVAEHLDVQLNSFVTVADVNKVKMYMKNFGEFYDDQISHASCILLSRTQTASEEKIAAADVYKRQILASSRAASAVRVTGYFSRTAFCTRSNFAWNAAASAQLWASQETA